MLADVPKPVTGPTDVVIKVKRAAICGTDLHIQCWDKWAAETVKPPVTIGYEFVGRVAAVGDQVRVSQ